MATALCRNPECRAPSRYFEAETRHQVYCCEDCATVHGRATALRERRNRVAPTPAPPRPAPTTGTPLWRAQAELLLAAADPGSSEVAATRQNAEALFRAGLRSADTEVAPLERRGRTNRRSTQ